MFWFEHVKTLVLISYTSIYLSLKPTKPKLSSLSPTHPVSFTKTSLETIRPPLVPVVERLHSSATSNDLYLHRFIHESSRCIPRSSSMEENYPPNYRRTHFRWDHPLQAQSGVRNSCSWWWSPGTFKKWYNLYQSVECWSVVWNLITPWRNRRYGNSWRREIVSIARNC